MQGIDPAECTDALFDREANPWDTYAACMTEGSAGGSPDIFARLPGVPIGKGCGLVSGGSQDTPVEEIVFEEDEVPVITATPPGATPPGGPNEPSRGTGTSTTGTGTSTTTGTVTSTDVDAFLETLKKSQRESPLLGETPSPRTPRRKLTKEDVISMEQDVIVQMLMGIRSEENGYEELQRLHELRKGLKGCLSPEDCADACTGLGAQVARARICTDDLLDAFREAIGRPAREPVSGGVSRPLDIVSIWDPQHGPVDDSDVGICLAGGPPARPSLGCSLVLCPQDGLALTIGEQCQCQQDLPAFQPVRALCFAIRCAEGTILTDDCTCQPTDVEPTPGLPPVGPVDRTRVPPVAERAPARGPAGTLGPTELSRPPR